MNSLSLRLLVKLFSRISALGSFFFSTSGALSKLVYLLIVLCLETREKKNEGTDARFASLLVSASTFKERKWNAMMNKMCVNLHALPKTALRKELLKHSSVVFFQEPK